MDDSTLAAEIAREQEQVTRAHQRLEELRAEAIGREKESLRPSGLSTPQSLYERDVQALAAAARRSDLDLAGEGLVFGRLDRADGQVLHLGRIGLRTEEQEPIVVDWRAPAAAPFYRATSAAPNGIVRRRTISSRGTTVVGVDDELLDPERAQDLPGTVVVGDGAFLAAVSRERTGRMRDIVATIQAEQDAAVRAPDDGALVVTGGPGTGKTAVALHRVAYLMYARREWYGRRGVLVVGPSSVFVDYISAVLPALGETSVRLAALADLPTLPHGWRATGWEPPAATAVKGSARMVDVLKRVVRALADPGGRLPDVETVRWGQALVVPGAELAKRRSQVRRGARSHNAGRAAFLGAVVDSAWRSWSRREEAPKEEPGDREDFVAWLKEEPAFVKAVEAAWPVLAADQVLDALRGGRVDLRAAARGLLDDAEVAAVQDAWAGGGPLTASDAALYDELVALLGPPPEPEPEDDEWSELDELDEFVGEVTTFADRNTRRQRRITDDLEHRTYAHVVVDEAQDVTPMQWRMLGRRARGASWTVVGDWAQSAWPDVQEVRDALRTVLGRARLREAELHTNYRTSTEIAALAARVLTAIDPDAEAPAAVRSTGVEPVVRAGGDVLDDLVAAVDELLAGTTGTVGVVAPYALLDAVQGRLGERPRLTVLDGWAVKGLEFDGCAVLQPRLLVGEALTREAGLRTLYVALTRATQRLQVVTDVPLEEVLAAPEPATLF
ncbi:MAG: AAA family ATPase [Actinomycetota bacterium]|nr:AAA family ATPase [Actinomycetota bacterium]